MLSNIHSLQFLAAGLVFACSLPLCSATIFAQEFRIESEVYVGDDKTPVSQNLTLFSDGLIYDFQLSSDPQPEPFAIAIYDTREHHFVLLDLARNQRLKLEEVEIIQMVEGLRQQTSQNDLTKFLVTDSFKEDFDVASGWAELQSPNIKYRFQGKPPPDVAILPLYFDFLDQFTRLKASDPTKLPPFPRLQLNQSIKKLGWIPTTVEVRMNKNQLFRSDISLSSKHTLMMNLSEKDHQRIKEAKTSWMQTKSVDLRTYRNLGRDPLSEIRKSAKAAAKEANPPVKR